MHEFRAIWYRMWRQWRFTAGVVLALGFGVAAVTLVFSAVNASLLKPLPFPQPDRLVLAWQTHPNQAGEWRLASLPDLIDWQREAGVFDSLAAVSLWRPVLQEDSRSRRLVGAKGSGELFSLLGARPFLGRLFDAVDDRAGALPVAVLSYSTWQSSFGGDRQVLGSQLHLDGVLYTVVGVLSPNFRVVEPLVFEEAQIWAPLALDVAQEPRGARFYRVLGRLAPGVTVAEADRRLEAVSSRLSERFPETNSGWSSVVSPADEEVKKDLRPPLLVLQATMLLVLLCVVSHLTLLLLARTLERRRDTAIRLSLGAAPRWLMLGLVFEAMILAAASALVGLALTALCLKLWQFLEPWHLASPSPVEINPAVVLFAFTAAMLSAGAAMGLPLLLMRKLRERLALAQAAGTEHRSRRSALWSDIFLGAEVTLSVVVLIVAGLMVKSFVQLTRVEPGFDPRGVLTMRLELPRDQAARASRLYGSLVERIRALPASESAALVSQLPLSGGSMSVEGWLPEAPESNGQQRPQVELREVSPDYFRTMGIELLAGRDFIAADQPRDGLMPPVVIVNQAAARLFWPRGRATDGRLLVSWGPSQAREVIGVVADVRHNSLSSPPRPEVYLPLGSSSQAAMTLVVRTIDKPRAAVAQVRSAILSVPASLVVSEVRTMEEVVAATITQTRLYTGFLTAFSLIALLLVAAGVYSVSTYFVAQRKQELGIRLTLGAAPRDLHWLVLRRLLLLAGAGVAAGWVGSLALRGLLQEFLFEVNASDPWILVGCGALLLAVVALAAYVPARRAASIDPVHSLRGAI